MIDGRHVRAVAFQGVRERYVGRVFGASRGASTLVVGGGRGGLARALARFGCDVTAVDPSAEATDMARELTAREELSAVHEVGKGEQLPFHDQSFDAAYYADTLEVTSELDRVLSEAARVVRPGGILIYDTVNRTLLSRLIYLGLFQSLPQTRIMPRGRYASRRLRPPDELVDALLRNGFRNEDIIAFKPARVRELVRAIRARKRGLISDDEIGSMVDFELAPDDSPVVTYLGYAIRL